jgi:hypothetical protein
VIREPMLLLRWACLILSIGRTIEISSDLQGPFLNQIQAVICYQAMAKTGRNDPCPCGSRKKYKHCCDGKESAWAGAPETCATDPDWVKIRHTEAEMVAEVLEFAVSSYGEAFLYDALNEFEIWGEYDADKLHRDTMFLPWAAFNFILEFEPADSEDMEERSEKSGESEELEEPDAREEIETFRESGESEEPEESDDPEEFGGLEDSEDLSDVVESLPAGIEYLIENIETLDKYQQAFIHEACSQPYSFFVVTGVTEGRSLDIRDLLLSRTLTVKEASASKSLKRGDIIFSRVIELDGQAIMLGVAPTILPARCHRHILDLRDWFEEQLRKDGLEFNQVLLHDLDLELRALYFKFVESLSSPAIPDVRNTDGDPLKFIKLNFKLDCTPQEALGALKPLALPEFQDVLANAVYSADGSLGEVRFDWMKRGNKAHKNWENTILGTLTIKGHELTAEVNSDKRAEKIKSEITKRLKKRVAFQNAVSESIEDKLEERVSEAGSPDWERERAEMEEFQSRPEVQAMLRNLIEAHWEAWYNQPVPALKNMTPLQAAKTKSGRERLEALLLEFENIEERSPSSAPRPDIAEMRKRLGLALAAKSGSEPNDQA